MKRSRTEKSPWIKSKAKPGPKKKKIDEFHPDKRKNLAESDKGSWFNQPSESEADGASSQDVPGLGVSRKKIMAISTVQSCWRSPVGSNNPYHQRMCPGTILDISGATRPFTASCTTLNALVKVASKEVTIEPDKM